jgi:hypothetical protein
LFRRRDETLGLRLSRGIAGASSSFLPGGEPREGSPACERENVCGFVTSLVAAGGLTYEYKLLRIHKAENSSWADPSQVEPELNDLGSQGWHVVEVLAHHTGMSTYFGLEREKT